MQREPGEAEKEAVSTRARTSSAPWRCIDFLGKRKRLARKSGIIPPTRND
jgi:hypothetical protein